MVKIIRSKRIDKNFIENLLNNYELQDLDKEANIINNYNEKNLSKELKKIIKNNSNNITGSGSQLKLKPIDTSNLIIKNV